jgi:hypothetical protein
MVMNKEESDLNNLIGNHCESLIRNYYESNGIKFKKISPDTKNGRRFDLEGIRNFLKGHPKQARVLLLLKEIKQRSKKEKKWAMPDFLVLTPENDIQFFEIKKLGMKFSLSNIAQRESLKFLTSKNFFVMIIRLKLPINKKLNPEEVLLLLQGKGHNGKKVKFVFKSVSSKDIGYLMKLVEGELELVYEKGGEIKIYQKTKKEK